MTTNVVMIGHIKWNFGKIYSQKQNAKKDIDFTLQ